MNRANKKITLLVFITIIFVFMLSSCTMPPRPFTVISILPPRDYSCILIINGETIQGVRSPRIWETHYRFHLPFDFYPPVGTDNQTAALRVTAHGETFDIEIDTEIFSPFSIEVTLDTRNRTITQGVPVGRTIFLFSLRVIFFIALAGAIFYGLGYREKKSWIIFAATSLIHEILFIILTGRDTFLALLLRFFFGTNLLLLIAMCILVEEHRRKRNAGLYAVLYALATNAVSFVWLSLWISYLPF